MADPLSISASIAGLTQLSSIIFHSTFKFIKSAKDAPESAEKLATEIRDLSGVLQSLELLATSQAELDTNPNIASSSFRATQISLCRQTLLKIKHGVQKAQDDFGNHSKMSKLCRSLKWPFSEEKTKSLLEELSRHKETVLLAATAGSIEELQKTLAGQAILQSTIGDLKDVMVKRLEAEQRVEVQGYRAKMRDYFLRVNPRPMLDSCLKLRQPLTGLWLTHTNQSFLLWKSTTGAKLWLTGITGCGKTILCASVVESLLQETDAKTGLAYFFCRYEEPATHVPTNVLSSLAAQLAIQKPEAFELLEQSYENIHAPLGLKKVPDVDDLLKLLEGICGLFDKVFIVADGVDECGKSATAVAEALCELGTRVQSVNLAVFSRKEEDLAATLSGEFGPNHVDTEFEHVNIAAHTDDIQLYVSSEMKSRRELRAIGNRNPELCRMIHDRLVNGAGEMFRWVACQLDYICDLDSDKARLRALNELPPTLNETYDRILQRVAQERSRKDVVQLVKKSLHWICYSGQSLSSKQLCEAVSVDPRATSIAQDEIVEEAAILRRCSSLIRRSASGDRFELAHFTVKEYLQTLDPESPLAVFRYDEYEAAQSLTAISLRYLMFLQFGKKPRVDDGFLKSLADRNRTHRFYPYAAMQWTKASLVQDDVEILRLSRQLFQADTSCYLNWAIQFLCDVIDATPGVSDECRDVTRRAVELKLPRLLMGAALGRYGICEAIVGQDLAESMDLPLSCALAGPAALLNDFSGSTYKHADPASLAKTLDVLLSRADENCVRTPLPFPYHRSHTMWALAACRSLESADLFEPFLRHRYHLDDSLLSQLDAIIYDKTADPKFVHSLLQLILNQEKDCQNERTLCEMVKTVQQHLTATGIWDEFEHQGNFRTTSMSQTDLSTALLTAVKEGNATHIRRLLADPRSSYLENEEFGLAALRWAVSRGHRDALEALLGVLDAKLEAIDGSGSSLMHYCCNDAHYSCLELLISRGLGTLSLNSSGKTVWHLAASHGSTRILELLLQSEDTAEALQMVTPAGRRPLEEALYRGHAQAASLLICGGLPPEHSLPDGLPITHLLVRCNSRDLFMAMQRIGLIIDLPALDGSTPLHHLQPSASPEFATFLKTLYDVRKPRHDGLTAVEVLLFKCSDFPDSSSVSARLIQTLLPHDHLVSLGSLHIWEFFTSKIVASYKTWQGGQPLKQTLPCEARALIAAGAVSSYERLRGQSACLPLFVARQGIAEYGVPSSYYAIIEAVVGATEILESMQRNSAAICLLKTVIRDSLLNDSVLEFLKLLLNKVRIDPTAEEEGQSAMEYLLSNPEPRRLKVFASVINSMELARLNDLLPSGRGILDHIILDSTSESEMFALARCLLDKGADPNNVCTEKHARRPAIVAAAKARSLDMMRLLLEYGASPLSRDSRGWDLAKYAAQHDDLDALGLLEADRTGATYDWTATCTIPSQTQAGEVLIEGCNLLHVAAFSGSTKIIKHLWQKGVVGDPNTRTANLLTPLHLAAMNGNYRVIKVLVEDLRADVFARASNGQLAFELSVTHGHRKATASLLQLTAGSVTYLELSICRGFIEICKKIIRQGCSVDCMMASCGGCTPLFVAVRAGRVDIARWLLQAGAKILHVQCQRHKGASSILEIAVLHLPAEHGFLQELLSKLLEQSRGMCVAELLDAARIAISRSHLPALSTILSHIEEHHTQYNLAVSQMTVVNDALGCILDLNLPNDGLDMHNWKEPTSATIDSSWTRLPLLHSAAQDGFLPAAEILVSYGADIELPDDNLRTPLAIAAAEGKPDMANFLLNKGALVDPLDRYGWTPLMLAAARQSLDVVEILEAHGADTRRLDPQGRSLLHLSVAYGNSPAVFHHLPRRGSDPYALDNLGRCPLYMAISRGGRFRSGIWDMGLLLGMPDEPDGPFNVLSDVVFSMDGPSALPRLFRCLPRDKARMLVNRKGRMPGRRSPLCAVAITGNVEAFRMLLRMGVDVEVEGSEHGTPIMEAAAHGRLKLVRLLVRHGAKLVYVNDLGKARNIFDVCRGHPRVQKWLLVGRFTEQRNKLLRAQGGIDGQGSLFPEILLPWSGPGVFRYVLPPEERQRQGESMLAYAARLAMFKARLSSCGLTRTFQTASIAV
ncbi:Ankyrin repeat-containing domain protein [Naviculisporaceae sp. PSN 640]